MTKDQKIIRAKTPMQTFLDALPLAREKSLQVATANQPTAA